MTTAAAGVQVQRSRWLLLFVALALVAVLLAAQSSSPAGQARRSSSAMNSKHSEQPAMAWSAPSMPALTGNQHTSPFVGSESVPARKGAPVEASASTTSSPDPKPPASTLTTTTINLASRTAAQLRTDNGWLSSPSSETATYDITTPSDATLTFSGATELMVSASCPSGERSVRGPSPLTLSGLEAGCSLTLSGPGALPLTSYSLGLVPR